MSDLTAAARTGLAYLATAGTLAAAYALARAMERRRARRRRPSLESVLGSWADSRAALKERTRAR